jgi:glycosyltransferase involved in cell wall biosynthesis
MRDKINNKSLVSTVIIFLNAEKFIQEAIQSVFAQIYNNWELLLVDDGSTDGSSQIALRYAEQYPEKVRYLEHPGHQNRGMSASRNLGISQAKGEYIALLDSDDVWLPHKLQQQVAIMDSYPETGMVYGLSQFWHSWTGNPEDSQRDYVLELGVQPDTLFKPPTLLTLLYPLGTAYAPCPSDLLLRREMTQRIGGFEDSFRGVYQMFEDQAFLSKVYLKEPVFVANECWDRYRQHPDQCVSVVEKAGQHHSVRLFFLNWLEEYWSEQRVEATEAWRLLWQEQRFAQMRVHAQKREWKQTMRDLLILLRYHPRRFVRTLQNLRLRRRLRRRHFSKKVQKKLFIKRG